MAKKAKTVTSADMVTQEMLFAEEEWAPMRPALAVAPELVMQAVKRAKKNARKVKATKVKARKASPKKARKATPKKTKARKTGKTKKVARKK